MIYAAQFQSYLETEDVEPLFLIGETLHILTQLPANSIDFCMTSPPYWGQREYQSGGIGEEKTPIEFMQSLLAVFQQVHRVLKPTGSFWLNIGDTYQDKGLLAIPWRIAIAMIDEQGWILRNGVIWNKLKGGLAPSADKLRNVHEDLFHFVKQPRGYYFNADAIKSDPRKAKVVNGAVVSATGVSGIRYKRQIELSTSLNDNEKFLARHALEEILNQIRKGELDDFRMVIRGQHRTTHSDSQKVSGRAKELQDKGFYFLKYDPKGTKPSDVWDILPEDKIGMTAHYAPYPEALCIVPLLATCPPDGIALDIFSGTGTTNLVAKKLGRKSVGVDISAAYVNAARLRTLTLL
jgi:DNA modification methylase